MSSKQYFNNKKFKKDHQVATPNLDILKAKKNSSNCAKIGSSSIPLLFISSNKRNFKNKIDFFECLFNKNFTDLHPFDLDIPRKEPSL